MKRRETIEYTGGKGKDIVSIVLAANGHMGCLITSAKEVVFFGALMFCLLFSQHDQNLTDLAKNIPIFPRLYCIFTL